MRIGSGGAAAGGASSAALLLCVLSLRVPLDGAGARERALSR